MTNKRGFMLAAAMMLIPICLILTFSLMRLVTAGAGFGLQAQQKMRAFYLAEAGVNTAFHLFGLGNFTTVTHQPDGTPVPTGQLETFEWPAALALTRAGDGWLEWRYDAGSDPRSDSFTNSGVDESFRFRVWFPDPSQPLEWTIECEAVLGNRRAFHTLSGVLKDPNSYLVFDNGDLADLARTSNQRMEGKIHTNGDLFVAPWETSGFGVGPAYIVPPSANASGNLTELHMTDMDLTVGEDLLRRRDFWNRTDSGLPVSLNGVSLGSNPNYYDSESPNWHNPGAGGALQTFNGRVITRDLGARREDVPHAQILEPGGYYAQRAGLSIDEHSAQPWLTKVQTYNEAEKQRVMVTEVDIAAMDAAGGWPSNNLLFASTPIRIKNGANLPRELTIASSETVYLQGDFNKKFHSAADRASNTERQKPAAIMTADRVYRLSEDFQDKVASDYLNPITDPDIFVHGLRPGGTKMRPAQDPPKFAGDPANVLEHNVVLVDSTPTEDTSAFAFAAHPSVYDPALKVRLTQDPVTGEGEFIFPSSDDYLENMSGLRFEHGGSEIHLRSATMVNGMFNQDYWTAPHTSVVRQGSGPTPYVLRSHYIPPSEYWHSGPASEAPGVFRTHDDVVTGLGGQPLPFALRSAQRTFWRSE